MTEKSVVQQHKHPLIPLVLILALVSLGSLTCASGRKTGVGQIEVRVVDSGGAGSGSGKDFNRPVFLLANTSQEYVPFQVTLTARINRDVIPPDEKKLIILWIEEIPGAGQYRSHEEIAVSTLGDESEFFFYRTYDIGSPGRHHFYLTLYPDNKEYRIHSNRVHVLARQIGVAS